MIQKQSAQNWATLQDPINQLTLIGMGRVVAKAADGGIDTVLLAEKPHLLGAAGDDVSEGPRRLVSDKLNGCLGSMNVVL